MMQVLPLTRHMPQFGLTRSPIQSTKEGLVVPDHTYVTAIAGDGIGPEIMDATKKVVDEAIRLEYGSDRSIGWVDSPAGRGALTTHGDPLPAETLRNLKRYRVGIKGPTETPKGTGHRSVNVAMRKALDTYACVRPLRSWPDVPMMVAGQPVFVKDVDLTIFRENTEDLYAGIEYTANDPKTRQIIERLRQDGHVIRDTAALGIKIATARATRRVMNQAIDYALENGKQIITIVHKANIQKDTDGMFLRIGARALKRRLGNRLVTESQFWKGTEEGGYGGDLANLQPDQVLVRDKIIDAMMQDMLENTQHHQVVVTTNLYGDILSDLAATIVGGLGVAPGANIGDKYALFEATHGTAPDIQGQNKANPMALMLSGAMMLDHMDWDRASKRLTLGIEKTLAQRKMTWDLAKKARLKKKSPRARKQPKPVEVMSTSGFTDAVVANMKRVRKEATRSMQRFSGYVKAMLAQ